MFRPIACLGVLLLAALSARAGTPPASACTSCDFVAGQGRILYATAATPGRVDSFCVDANGRLRPSQHGSITGLDSPRRLLVDQQNHRLYVAEKNAVSAFEIKPGGALAKLWHFPAAKDFNTKAFRQTQLDLQDLALASDCATLYVPAKKPGRILALIGLDTAPPVISSCAQGPTKPGYRNLIADGGVLYSSGSGSSGRIDAFRLGTDGALAGQWNDDDGGDCRPTSTKCDGNKSACNACGAVGQKACPEECGAPICPIPRPALTSPDSTRRNLSKPLAFQILDSPPGAQGDRFLYVAERGNKQLIGFRLRADGLFDDATRDGSQPQKPFTRLRAPVIYLDLVARTSDDPGVTPTLVGSQFNDGLLESFALATVDDPSVEPGDCHVAAGGDPAPSVCLPKHKKSTTGKDLRLSPVRMRLCRNQDGNDWLYVATGLNDRIQAVRLSAEGRLETDTIQSTPEKKGSFPNDVAVAVLEDSSCQ